VTAPPGDVPPASAAGGARAEARPAVDPRGFERTVGDQAAGEVGGAGTTDLQPDVERLHRAILREPRDPVEGREPPPWWFVGTIVLALFWGGWYLGRYGGEFGTQTHIAIRDGRQAEIAGAAAGAVTAAAANPVEQGERIYLNNCQGCHQQSGRGVAGAFPPVVGSEWVTGPSETLVRILLHGLQGPVQVAGVAYNGAMPAWKDVLKDEEIAAVLTYLRQWKPNAAPAIAGPEVAALRTAHADRTAAWTAAELRAEEGNRPAPAAGTTSTPGQAGPTPVGPPAAGPGANGATPAGQPIGPTPGATPEQVRGGPSGGAGRPAPNAPPNAAPGAAPGAGARP
jgi:mono/diheme cytochrome c family protein